MSDTKKYYWLKLKNDFFNQREVKKLRKIAGGDTFTIIYLKMQLLSIKNGGVITFERTEAHLDEQLALELDEDLENIRLTMAYLHSNALIEPISEDDILLNKVPELIGSETNAAERMRKMRIKRNDVTPQLQDVTQSKSKEIELKRDIELYRKIQHLPFSNSDNEQLKVEGWSQYQIDTVLDKMENYGKLKTYKSAILTARNWLKKDYPIIKVIEDQNPFLNR